MSIPNACLPLFRFLPVPFSSPVFLLYFIVYGQPSAFGLLNFPVAESFGLSRAICAGKWWWWRMVGGSGYRHVGVVVAVVSQPVCVLEQDTITHRHTRAQARAVKERKSVCLAARNRFEARAVMIMATKEFWSGSFHLFLVCRACRVGYDSENNWIMATCMKLKRNAEQNAWNGSFSFGKKAAPKKQTLGSALKLW